ncbi:MAG TPA: flagellar motor protein MotA [Candidatus Dormibacteraeota bacterium]|nr:flagellar motor protein MotA [Candidatus Dormibacteraeota bacterium]
MLLFLVAVACVVYFLLTDLVRVFLNTPTLDAVILGVLVIGIFFVFRQVIILWPEVSWMRRYRQREPDAPPPPAQSINLLAPMAAMLGERPDEIRLSPTATRAMLDGIATRLDERRELARYMIGLLIFLGLLGTFWGLLQTIGAVADAINSLQVSAGDAAQMFAKLKGSIEGPLVGMSTAFGASLFGLSGSLVLGFLELQASQAQGRFHIELEEWLARATSLSSAGLAGTPQGIPAYVEALLERNTEGVDGLIRGLQRVEDSRLATAASNASLIERLAALAETTRAQQNLLAQHGGEWRQQVDMVGARRRGAFLAMDVAAQPLHLGPQDQHLTENEEDAKHQHADDHRVEDRRVVEHPEQVLVQHPADRADHCQEQQHADQIGQRVAHVAIMGQVPARRRVRWLCRCAAGRTYRFRCAP